MARSKVIGKARGILTIAERMNNSTYGNPRFLLNIGTEVFRTKPDAAYSYDVENDRGKYVEADIISYFGHATVANYRVVQEE